MQSSIPADQTDRLPSPPTGWLRAADRLLLLEGSQRLGHRFSPEEHARAVQIAAFHYSDTAPITDAVVKARDAILADRRPAQEPQQQPAPRKPRPVGEPVTRHISDEDFLVLMAGHIEDLSHSFRRSYNLRYEDMNELAQELRIKCCAIPPEMRSARQYCKTALNNKARDWWRSQHRYESRAVLADDHDMWEVLTIDDRTDEKIDAEKFLAKLTATQREIVTLAVMTAPAWSVAKIAKHLRVPVKQVEEELANALRVMREYARQGG
jgi:DNA-directed RNA polymerase specialized sigma24 family protein